ncbi:MAG TPA: deaminase [Conexibacter sp.]|jgi:cytidine deaminase|nr:deaminase [Conexibacter sp.]
MSEAHTDQTELFIALVAAVGTDVGLVGDHLQTQLTDYGYTTHLLRLSVYLAEQASEDFRDKPFDESLWDAMTTGDELRRRWDRSDALALHAVSDIVATREQLAEAPAPGQREGEELPANLSRHAFIVRSLKTPDELETLRAIYGPRLVVIAAFSPKELRERHLGELIEDSRKSAQRDTWRHKPDELIARDEKEEAERGQDVSGTFHRADFFIRGWDRDVIRADVARTLEILFGSPFRTPTREEYGQFLAAGAALRSAEFGRQVGAAIATADGSVIALGTNEVPKVGGGSVWEEEGKGNRDFEVGDQDTNRRHFDELAKRLTARVDGHLDELADELGESAEVRAALGVLQEKMHAALPDDLRAGGLKDLTEFGRAVHAEMNALLDAARRGAPVAGATLHTTTFPCHNCARHIIGAGIARIVFVEPYAKSRAVDLHDDALTAGSPLGTNGKIRFDAFVGVAPRRYLEMFDAAARERMGHVPRKDASGHRVPFVKLKARPVFADAGLPQFRPEFREYRAKELLALEHFERLADAPSDPSGPP